jgi:predicted nucleotidyltransferase
MEMKFKTIPDLDLLIDFVVSKYKPEKIILFGSYATKTERTNSDIDLLIIKETNKRFVDRVIELVQLIRARFGFKYPVEPIIYTPEEWNRAEKINSSFIRLVLSKGVVLYEKE